MPISLIIKGNKRQAKRNAEARGVMQLYNLREVTHTGSVETVAFAHPTYEPQIVKWFAEAGRAPFPVGALLLYTHSDQ